MIKLICQAALRKKIPLDSEQLKGLLRTPVLWHTYMPDNEYYERYCQQVHWAHDTIIHPFFWQVKSLSLQLQLLAHAQSPFPLLGMVHLKNRIEHYAESRTDIPCEIICRFGSSYQHRKGIATEVIVTGTQRGKRVYVATATFLTKAEKQINQLAEYESYGIGDDGFEQCGINHSDPGLSKCIGELAINQREVRKYARLSGDFNPIHLSNLSAKLFGFERAIAHGMFTGAKVISMFNRQQDLNGAPVDMTFRRPMLLPALGALYTREGGSGVAFSLRAADPKQDDVYSTGTFVGLQQK